MMPLDVDLERERLKRRRAVAEAQLAASMRPVGDAPMVSGIQTRLSPLAPIAQVAQALAGQRGMRDVDKQEETLGNRARAEVAAALADYTRATTPRAAQAGTMDTEFGTSEYEIPGYNPTPQDRQAAVTKLLGAAGGDPRDSLKLIVAQAMKGPEVAKVEPKDYTPESWAAYLKSGDTSALRAAPKVEPPKVSELALLQRELAALPEGDPRRADYEAKIKKLTTHAPAPSASATAIAKGNNKYLERRMTDDAEAVAKLYSAAEGAMRNNQALDRVAASNQDAFAGAAAPLMGAAANFLSSFGYDSKSLTNTAAIQQAIGEMLGNRMSELGARGLTDKDMEILRDNLPRVDQSRDSRRLVVAVLKKANHGTIAEAQAQLKQEREAYPDMRSARRHSWADYVIPSEGTTGSAEVDALIDKYTRGAR